MSSSVIDEDGTTTVFVRTGAAGHRPALRAGGRSGLWNPAEVAAFLQVSRSWVYQKAEAGLIPVIRLPGSSLLRFEPSAIESFAKGEWVPPAQATGSALRRRKHA